MGPSNFPEIDNVAGMPRFWLPSASLGSPLYIRALFLYVFPSG